MPVGVAHRVGAALWFPRLASVRNFRAQDSHFTRIVFHLRAYSSVFSGRAGCGRNSCETGMRSLAWISLCFRHGRLISAEGAL